MGTSPPDAQRLADAGIGALRIGDAAAARRAFDALVGSGHATADDWLGLAYACAMGSDTEAALRAIDGVLRLDPGSLRALALKGDLLLQRGEVAKAAAFYQAAAQSVPDPATLPEALQREHARVTSLHEQLVGRLTGDLRAAIGEPASARLAQGLDILFGRRQIYHSQPRHFYLPELPSIQFHDRASFPWLDAIEAATDDIRAEMLAMLGDDGNFVPYLQSEPDRPPAYRGSLTDSRDWTACHLWRHGRIVEAHAARCPRTMAALAHAPQPRLPGRSPAALFSQLRPGAHIPPHHGFVNTRLIVHLPLVVPPGCRFRVGNETRAWEEGKAWAFDDTIEHEAWNPSDRTRVILLFEVWRPELSAAEQAQVSTMFEAIDRQRGSAPEWGI